MVIALKLLLNDFITDCQYFRYKIYSEITVRSQK